MGTSITWVTSGSTLTVWVLWTGSSILWEVGSSIWSRTRSWTRLKVRSEKSSLIKFKTSKFQLDIEAKKEIDNSQRKTRQKIRRNELNCIIEDVEILMGDVRHF